MKAKIMYACLFGLISVVPALFAVEPWQYEFWKCADPQGSQQESPSWVVTAQISGGTFDLIEGWSAVSVDDRFDVLLDSSEICPILKVSMVGKTTMTCLVLDASTNIVTSVTISPSEPKLLTNLVNACAMTFLPAATGSVTAVTFEPADEMGTVLNPYTRTMQPFSPYTLMVNPVIWQESQGPGSSPNPVIPTLSFTTSATAPYSFYGQWLELSLVQKKVTLSATVYPFCSSLYHGVTAAPQNVTTSTVSLTGLPFLRACNFGTNGNARILLGQPAALNLSGRCAISAWIRPVKTDGLRDIVARGYRKNPNREIYLRFNNGQLQFGYWCETEKRATVAYTNTLGVWTHVIGVYDGGAYKLYVNGRCVAQEPATLAPVTFDSPWSIGRHPENSERGFAGEIGEVTFYHDAPSAADCALLYQAGVSGLKGASPDGVWRCRYRLESPDSGLVTVVTQAVALVDSTAPLFQFSTLVNGEFPQGTNVINTVPPQSFVYDAVTTNPVVSYSDGSFYWGKDANNKIFFGVERFWQAEDAAGLRTLKTQSFRFADTLAPTLIAPTNVYVEETQDISAAITGIASASDSSAEPLSLVYRDIADSGLGLNLVYGSFSNTYLSAGVIATNTRVYAMDVSKPFTLSACILMTTNTTSMCNILSKGYVWTPAPREIIFRVKGNNIEFGYWDQYDFFVSSPLLTSDYGRKVVFTGVFDGDAFSLYRENVLIAKTASSAGRRVKNFTAPWAIGRASVTSERLFSIGKISNVGIWDRPLSARERQILVDSVYVGSDHVYYPVPLDAVSSNTLRTVVRNWRATDYFGNISSSNQWITITHAYVDSDLDGVCDYLEHQYGMNPFLPDTDNDSLSDFNELFVHYTNPSLPDSDGDLMRDEWEVFYGLKPQDPADAYEDPDSDGLSNLAEFRAGTNPTVADSDGDGLNDGVEVLSARSDPKTVDIYGAAPVTIGSRIAGATATINSGSWRAGVSNELRAVERAGSLTYQLTVPEPTPHALAVRLSQSTIYANTSSFEISLKIDGIFICRLVTVAPYGSPQDAFFFLPNSLASGEHTFQLTWHNWQNNTFLIVHDLRFVTFGAPDANGNGTADWIDTRSTLSGTLDVLPLESIVSPLCVEGEGTWRNVFEIRAHSATNDAIYTVIKTIGDGFYADVALPDDGSSTVISLDDAVQAHEFPVCWMPFDVFSGLCVETGLVVRAGDALRLAGPCADETTISIYHAESIAGSNAWLLVTNIVAAAPVPFAFDNAGDYLLAAAAYLPNDSVTTGISRVTAIHSAFPSQTPALLFGQKRVLECPSLDPRTLIEHHPALTVTAEPSTNTAGGVALTLDATVDSSMGLLSRLAENGPICDAVHVVPILADNGSYYHILQAYPDGSQLAEVVLYLGALPAGLEVKLEIFVAGVTFEDGTRTKMLTTDDFDEQGVVRLRFIRAVGVQTSVCHRTYFYQDGTLIYAN